MATLPKKVLFAVSREDRQADVLEASWLPFAFRMTVESILERINQKSFRPIALETVDKTWIKVDREADIFIYDRMETACVVILDPMRRKFVFTPEQISAIETR